MSRFIGCIFLIGYVANQSVDKPHFTVDKSDVIANQNVTFTCTFQSGTLGFTLFFPSSVKCLYFFCESKLCGEIPSSLKCLNNKTYQLTILVKAIWNQQELKCGGPFGGKSSDPIFLNISVPVNSLTLKPNQITVNASELINLTCEASPCYPKATIRWYIKGEEIIDQSIIRTEDKGGNDDYNIQTTSFLQYTGDIGDNRANVYCTAINLPDQIVESEVNVLDVQYPPTTAVYILANPSGLVYATGTNITLTCRQSDGNPVSMLSWNCNGLDMPGTNLSNSTEAVSELKLTVDKTFNKQDCNCIANHKLFLEPTTSKVHLTVNVPVTNVTLIERQFSVNDSEQMDLTCISDFCNPQASITWYIGDGMIKTNTSTNFTTGNYNLLQTTSTLHYKGVESDNRKHVYCKAYNSISTTVESSKYLLDVKYPPSDDPVISSSSTHFVYISGDSINITCIQSGGNPIASLSWECSSTVLNIETHSNSTLATSVVFMKADKNLNNKDCTCIASHPLETKRTSVKLTVYYESYITSTFNETYEICENRSIRLVCSVDGNPLSNITWIFLKKNETVETNYMSNNSVLEISSAKCEQHGKYRVSAKNEIGTTSQTTAIAVKCKPRQYTKDSQVLDKLGIGKNDSLNITLRILLYPPSNTFQWILSKNVNESAVINNGTDGYILTNTIVDNEQNITLFKQNVTNEEFGNYTITVTNSVGNFTKMYQVNAARTPDVPRNIKVVCEISGARVQWISSFNGGDTQTFIIHANGDRKTIFSSRIPDAGENTIHTNYVENLQASVSYVFHVSAQNRYGNSSSENITCITLKKDTGESLPLIVGGAAAGGIALAVIAIAVVLLRRYIQTDKQAGKKQRLKQAGENEDTSDDGMKDNILYESAGPKDDEKPEAAVYAAVNKKLPESNNNANVYAEVNKSGRIIGEEGALYSDVKPKRGLFKKDKSRNKDGNPKQKKGKKQKSKQDVADVYENSEDIPMSSKSDNVYSNAGQKVQNKEERGYKNKDGLLYVEVKFDAKTEKGNQTIHGEDEKTDYATVEFPMAASKPDESGNEKI